MNNIKINYTYETLLYLIKKEAHGREIAKELKTSLTRIQLILGELRKMNVLDYRVEGRNNLYFIKKNLISKSFVLNSENYKLIKLLMHYPLLEPMLREILDKYPKNMILLFGSYAKFIPKETSDIDIYIETENRKIKEEIQKINNSINVKIGLFNTEDLLIKEIIKNKIIINGTGAFYERLRFFK